MSWPRPEALPGDLQWRRRSGLLSWGVEIPNVNGEAADVLLHRSVVDIARLLGPFGQVRDVSWTVRGLGDDAVVQTFPPETLPDERAIPEPIVAEAYAAQMGLDLFVRYSDEPMERVISQGATVFFEYDELQHQSADGPTTGVYINVSLDVNIYDRRPYSFTAHDNRELADLNAPRLNRFLREVQTHFGHRFTFIESESGSADIDHNGFRSHD